MNPDYPLHLLSTTSLNTSRSAGMGIDFRTQSHSCISSLSNSANHVFKPLERDQRVQLHLVIKDKAAGVTQYSA